MRDKVETGIGPDTCRVSDKSGLGVASDFPAFFGVCVLGRPSYRAAAMGRCLGEL